MSRRRSRSNRQRDGRCFQRSLGAKLSKVTWCSNPNVFIYSQSEPVCLFLVLTALVHAISIKRPKKKSVKYWSWSCKWWILTKHFMHSLWIYGQFFSFYEKKKKDFKKSNLPNLYAVNIVGLNTPALISFQSFPDTQQEWRKRARHSLYKSVLAVRHTYGCYKRSLTWSCIGGTWVCWLLHRLWHKAAVQNTIKSLFPCINPNHVIWAKYGRVKNILNCNVFYTLGFIIVACTTLFSLGFFYRYYS